MFLKRARKQKSQQFPYQEESSSGPSFGDTSSLFNRVSVSQNEKYILILTYLGERDSTVLKRIRETSLEALLL